MDDNYTFMIKKSAILLLAIAIITSFVIVSGVEYKTYDNEYFRAEYPMEWTVHESKGETLDYYFLSDRKLANGVREGVTVRVGFNGLNIDCSISQLSGDFNETGFLDEPLIHFFTTFQVKAQPKLKDTPISSISPKRITTPLPMREDRRISERE